MTGILALTREAFNLFSPDSDIARQKDVFWSCVRIAFIISAFAAWVIQYRRIKELELTIEQKLIIEFKDVFLSYIRPTREWNDDNSKTFLTIVFSITNLKNEINTIKSCRFLIKKNTGEIEGKKRNATILKNGEKDRRHGGLDIIKFQQGIPLDYPATFEFDEDNNPYASDENNLADKSFTVILVDSYEKEYKYEGRTPKDLMQTLTRFHF